MQSTPDPSNSEPTSPIPDPPSRDWHRDTAVVVTGRPDRIPDAPLNQPIVPASTFVAGGPLGYGRYGNPSWSALEDSIAALEGGTALTFASGMAAVSAVLDLVPSGGRLVLAETCYLGVAALVDRLSSQRSIDVATVTVTDTAAVLTAADGADMVWLESPTNPLMEVADLAAILSGLGSERSARVVIDNTFASPLQQQPLLMGADIVVHSATKLMSGHSDALLGAVVCADPAVTEQLDLTRRLTGSIPGALETFLVHRGLRTLSVRLAAASASASVLAGRLGEDPRIARVRHPGWGTMLAIELSDAATADRLCAATRLWVHATSLGGVESSFERRRRWASELPIVPEGLVRMSVGVEHVEDLWSDLDQALTAAVG